jgi:uncharacterized protein
MNPILFGASRQPLFGVYQPSKARRARETGVVLCYPLGQEYMRAHRAFRQLALLLTKAGFHVLRFDYFGTGDSSGESDEGSVAQWVRDAGVAADELKDTTGVTRVAFVGLRLGAAIAALAASERRDVTGVVMWDPVLEGVEYVRELLDGAPASPTETVGVLGFPLTPALRAELESTTVTTLRVASETRLRIVTSEERSDCQALRDALTGGGAKASYECVATPGNWNEVDNYGSVLIPQAVIQAIVAFLVQETR